jgi:hypothetical protein
MALPARRHAKENISKVIAEHIGIKLRTRLLDFQSGNAIPKRHNEAIVHRQTKSGG